MRGIHDIERTPTGPYQHRTVAYPNKENFEMIVRASQTTIDRQNEMMEHIDDRALSIVRTAAVLLGIIISGLNVALSSTQKSPVELLNLLTESVVVVGSIGVAFLVVAVLTGVVTTQYSRPVHGTGQRPRVRIRNRPSRGQSLRELSREYDDQIREMAGRIESNRTILWVLQIEMVGAVVSLALAMGFTENSRRKPRPSGRG